MHWFIRFIFISNMRYVTLAGDLFLIQTCPSYNNKSIFASIFSIPLHFSCSLGFLFFFAPSLFYFIFILFFFVFFVYFLSGSPLENI